MFLHNTCHIVTASAVASDFFLVIFFFFFLTGILCLVRWQGYCPRWPAMWWSPAGPADVLRWGGMRGSQPLSTLGGRASPQGGHPSALCRHIWQELWATCSPCCQPKSLGAAVVLQPRNAFAGWLLPTVRSSSFAFSGKPAGSADGGCFTAPATATSAK